MNFDTLKTQCLALPEEERSALVEALQKQQRDWAWDVWVRAFDADWELTREHYSGARQMTPDELREGCAAGAAVIRSMCRPREVELDEALLRKFAHELCWQPKAGIQSILVRFLREALS